MDQNEISQCIASYPRVRAVKKPVFFTTLVLYVVSMVFFMVVSGILYSGLQVFDSQLKIEPTAIGHKITVPSGKSVEFRANIFGQMDINSFVNELQLMDRQESEQFVEELKASGNEALKTATFGGLDMDMSSEIFMRNGFLIVLLLLGMSILTLPYFIVFYMLLYKVWKGVAPLKSLDREVGRKVISPVLAVVLCFIPVVNWVWVVFCYARYPQLGERMASVTGREYKGPGVVLVWSFVFIMWVLSVVGICGLFVGYFNGFLFYVSTIGQLIALIFWIAMGIKMRDEVESLALPQEG